MDAFKYFQEVGYPDVAICNDLPPESIHELLMERAEDDGVELDPDSLWDFISQELLGE